MDEKAIRKERTGRTQEGQGGEVCDWYRLWVSVAGDQFASFLCFLCRAKLASPCWLNNTTDLYRLKLWSWNVPANRPFCIWGQTHARHYGRWGIHVRALAHQSGSIDEKGYSALVHLPLPPHNRRRKWSFRTAPERRQIAWISVSYMGRKALSKSENKFGKGVTLATQLEISWN